MENSEPLTTGTVNKLDIKKNHFVVIRPKTGQAPSVRFKVQNQELRDVKGFAFWYAQILALVCIVSCCCGVCMGAVALSVTTQESGGL